MSATSPPDAGQESLVSPFVGVVRGVQEVLAGPEDIRLATAFCESAHAELLVGAPRPSVGGGSGRGQAAARAAAVGEAVERYSACYVDPGSVVVASARELGRRAVDPARFALFSALQYATPGFRYVPFRRETRVAWVEGRRLPDGEPAWLPAQLAYLTPPAGEPLLCRTTSNGLASHPDAAEATLRALLEVVERDAFMIVWKARLSCPRLDRRGSPELQGFWRRFVQPTGLLVRAVDLSAFWELPCVLAVARSGVAGAAPVGVGAAAGASVERAVEKAVDEAVRVRSWAQALRRAGSPEPAEVRDFDDHVRFYAEPRRVQRTLFLDGSRRRRRAGRVPRLEGADPSARIAAVCERLARRGVCAYAVDVTSPDVREAGLTVVRVIAPELCGLDVEHDAPLLGGDRLYSEPERLGLLSRRLREAEVNPDPHPFP